MCVITIDFIVTNLLIIKVPNDLYVGRYQLSRFGNADKPLNYMITGMLTSHMYNVNKTE
jgi:hypothetical protein